jgi:hypothetical protein
MIDAIAMTEVIPFRLQENGGRAGHSLGAIQPFSVAATHWRCPLANVVSCLLYAC